MSKFFSNEVNGLLILNKPVGLSSSQALQSVRKRLRAKKAGHTGTLDPLASGVLPLCFGEATKYASELLSSCKTYFVTAQLGITTDTGDAEGKILTQIELPEISELQLQIALRAFTGDIMQVPPMYSALKHQGQSLYKLARAGQSVERPARPVTVYHLELLDWQSDLLSFRAVVSKGTYIRTLVEDIGTKLGVGGHVRTLCRETSAGFDLCDSIELEALLEMEASAIIENLLRPVSKCVEKYPVCCLDENDARMLLLGQKVPAPPDMVLNHGDDTDSVVVSLFGPDQLFLGLGELIEQCYVKPKRLVASKVY